MHSHAITQWPLQQCSVSRRIRYSSRTTGISLSDKAHLEVKKEYFSNVNPELIRIPVHKETLGIMYLTQGVFGHELDVLREQLREVDAQSEWGRNLLVIKEDAKACLKKRDNEWKRMHYNIARIDKTIKRLESSITEEEASDSPRQVCPENMCFYY
jgi:hypothetical protein